MVYIQNDSGIPLCHPFPVSYEIRYIRVYSEGREREMVDERVC